jgi:uncharacterized SAM-binding protein YcdF (DUF218 family)
MTYWLIKGLMQPFTLLMLCVGVGVFWRRRALDESGRKWPRRWLMLSYALLYLYCTPVAAMLSHYWLETRFARQLHRPEDLDAIVVLSGGALNPFPGEAEPYLTEDTALRCQRAIELYREGPPCPIVASGGVVFGNEPLPPLAEIMRTRLIQSGVAPEDVFVENRSTNTEENANFSAEIIRQHGWRRIALVTSSAHLWRSEHLFRWAGIETIPVGCMHRSDEFAWSVFSFLPSAGAAARHQEAMHEFIGELYLLLRGKW